MLKQKIISNLANKKAMFLESTPFTNSNQNLEESKKRMRESLTFNKTEKMKRYNSTENTFESIFG